MLLRSRQWWIRNSDCELVLNELFDTANNRHVQTAWVWYCSSYWRRYLWVRIIVLFASKNWIVTLPRFQMTIGIVFNDEKGDKSGRFIEKGVREWWVERRESQISDHKWKVRFWYEKNTACMSMVRQGVLVDDCALSRNSCRTLTLNADREAFNLSRGSRRHPSYPPKNDGLQQQRLLLTERSEIWLGMAWSISDQN